MIVFTTKKGTMVTIEDRYNMIGIKEREKLQKMYDADDLIHMINKYQESLLSEDQGRLANDGKRY